jgi:hypothetical protein
MSKYWSIDEFREVVKGAKTIREVLQHFGLPKNQGHYNREFHKTDGWDRMSVADE